MTVYRFDFGPSTVSSVTKGLSKAQGDLQKELQELRTGQQTLKGRISFAPEMIKSGRVNPALADIERIVSEGESGNGGFLGSIFGNPIVKNVLAPVGAVLGTAQRAVVSTLQEGLEGIRGEGGSFGDWFDQIKDPSYGVGTVMREHNLSTGNKKLDAILAMAGDIITDPLTYITFGSTAFAGRAGRIALATKAAEAGSIAKAPTLANKIDDIVRYGEFALDDAERLALGVQKGLRWRFGDKLIGGKVSGGIAQRTGRGWSEVRSLVGDIPGVAKGLGKIRPKSYAGGLTMAGRGTMATQDLVQELAHRSALNVSKGVGRVFGTQLADEWKGLVDEVAASPYRSTVYELVENPALVQAGTRAGGEVISEAEKRLASRITAFFDSARAKANNAIGEYSTRTGMNAVPVGNIGDYFHHTLTNEGREWLARMSRGEKNPFGSTEKFLQDLDLTFEEFTRGAPQMRARKLVAGKDFLGEPLKEGSIQEINRISMEKLGFKFFEEDAVSVINSYVNSTAKTASRLGYAERMLDFGTNTAKALTKQLIPDKQVVAAIEKQIKKMNQLRRVLTGNISKGAGVVKAELGKAERGLSAEVARREGSYALTSKQVQVLSEGIDVAQAQLDELRTVVATKSQEVQDAFETVAGPIQDELNQMRSARDSNQLEQLAQLKTLQDEYVKTFPNAKKIPDDVEVLSGRVQKEARRQARNTKLEIDKQIKDLQKQIDELPSVPASGERLQQLEAQKVALQEQSAEIANIIDSQAKAPYASDGLIYLTNPSEIDDVTVAIDFTTRNSFDVTKGLETGELAAMPAPPVEKILDLTVVDDFYQYLGALEEGIATTVEFALQQTPPPYTLIGTTNRLTNSNFINAVTYFEKTGKIAQRIYDEPFLGEAYADMVRASASLRDTYDNPEAFFRAKDYLDEATQNWFDHITALADGTPNQYQAAAGDVAKRWGIVPEMNPSNGSTMWVGDVAQSAEAYGVRNYTRGSKLGYSLDSLTDNSLDGKTIRLFNDIPDYVTGETTGDIFEKLDLIENSPTYSSVARSSQDIDSQIANIEKQIAGTVDETRLGELQQQLRSLQSRKGGVMGASTRKQARAAQAEEAYKGAETVTIRVKDPKTGKVVKKTLTNEQADAEIAVKELFINKGRNAVQRQLGKEQTMVRDVTGGTKQVSLRQQEQIVDRLKMTMDKVAPIAASDEVFNTVVKPFYQRDIDDLLEYIATKPASADATSEQLARWAQGAQAKLEAIRGAGIPEDVRTKLDKVVTQLLGDEADLAFLEFSHGALTESLDKAKAGIIGGQLREMADKGWTALYGTGVQVPNEVRDLIFSNVQKLSNPSELSKFLKAYQKYHQFFKTYAILTPGFVVRNSISSAFMNFVAGVPSSTQIDAVGAAFNYARKGPSKWLEGYAPDVAREYEEAWRIAAATGAGQTVDDMISPALAGGKGSRIINNKATRAGARGNEAAEFSARFAMALDGVRKGLPFDANVNRVGRFHFDYTDLSKLDEAMRQIVPFWIWTSRNIPLQIANMWTRPSVYSTYEQIKKNAPVDSNIIMPKWLKNAGPIGLTGGTVLLPDLPQTRLEDAIRQIIEPRRLAGQLNPALKLPFEMTGNVQYSTNVPFSDEPVEAKGLDVLAAILGMPFGATQVGAGGKLMIDPKWQYALGDLLPPIARVQRLIPETGGKSTYGDRRASSLATFLGIPIRQVPLSEQQGEVLRRQRLLQEYASRMQDLGFLPPVNG